MQKNQVQTFKNLIFKDKYKSNFLKQQNKKPINLNKFQTEDSNNWKNWTIEFDIILPNVQLITNLKFLSIKILNLFLIKLIFCIIISLNIEHHDLKHILLYFLWYKYRQQNQQFLNLIQSEMNWTEPRKSYKSSQQGGSGKKKIQTTCLNTPIFDKDYKSCKYQFVSCATSPKNTKNCPYHFNNQDHVCLTCRKSVCLRCAITYCQNHQIKSQKQIIPLLIQDIQKIYAKQKRQQILTRLGQSLQRQQHIQKKLQNLVSKIEDNFNSVIQSLKRKKTQIIAYYDKQFHKCLSQYQQYDQQLRKKLLQIQTITNQCASYKNSAFESNSLFSIQKIDQIISTIKDHKVIMQNQKNINNFMQTKTKISQGSLWSQEKLEKVLLQIQNIPYRIQKQLPTHSLKTAQKKKRIATQNSQNPNKLNISGHKSPPIKHFKQSGRIILNNFHSGRKSRGQRFERSDLL